MTWAFLLLATLLIVIPICAMLFLKASPARMAAVLRVVVGGMLLAVGTLLATRGLTLVGGPVAFFGFMMLSRAFGMGRFAHRPGGKAGSDGRVSTVRTGVLAMELDHDSGTMDGDVLTGRFAGRRLSELSLEQLVSLTDECRAAGDQSPALLEAYLDRVHPDWREGAGNGNAGEPASGPPGMSRREAYDILGLEPGAGEDEIVAAHRRMMKQYHPDQGGSDYLAARINQAKDLLLGAG